jgi:thiamine monophosphate kinase
MNLSIFHIGLHLDHPSIPAEERPKITKKLSDMKEMMRGAGYDYEIVFCSPESGLEDFKRQLRTQPCDGVLIGGGVAGDPAMTYFMEQIIDAIHEAAPKAKIMFFNHSTDVRTTVERWLKPRST